MNFSRHPDISRHSWGVWIFRGSVFSRHPGLRVFRGSVFSIHPGGLSFRYTQGVCVFHTLRGSEFFWGGLCFRYTQGSEFLGRSVFSIHPGGRSFSGGLCFRYTQGSEFLGRSVFSIHPGGLRFSGGLCFRYTQGVWVFWGVCVFNTLRGLSFSGSEICVFDVWGFVTPLICFVLHTELSNFSH